MHVIFPSHTFPFTPPPPAVRRIVKRRHFGGQLPPLSTSPPPPPQTLRVHLEASGQGCVLSSQSRDPTKCMSPLLTSLLPPPYLLCLPSHLSPPLSLLALPSPAPHYAPPSTLIDAPSPPPSVSPSSPSILPSPLPPPVTLNVGLPARVGRSPPCPQYASCCTPP